MGFELPDILNATLALLAIINPLGNLPIFVELTSELDKSTRRRLFNLAATTGYVTLMVLTFTGQWIMERIFNISMGEFQIAGGIVLIVVAVRNTVFREHRGGPTPPQDIMDLGVVPIAVPLMVGPGAIATGILILNSSETWVTAFVSISVTFLFTWFVLHCSEFLLKLIGHIGSLVLSRVLQLFIAAIGVKFLMSGIHELVKLWK